MKKRILYALLLTGTPAMVAAQEKKDSIVLTRSKNVARVQNGIASFYHNKFEGRKTANGEIFTQYGLRAASNSIPLNCWFRVSNIRNKTLVLLSITDRFFHKNPSLFDLSRSAGVKLGSIG